MKILARQAATSLILIVFIAFCARGWFAANQASKIPHAALAVVPFQQEAGNVAFALASGKGFANVFRTETGPTAWLAPVYPLLLSGIFRAFGSFTVSAFFAAVFLNIIFSTATCIPIFYCTQRLAGLGPAAAAAWLWAFFPAGIIFPFEWIWDTSLSALLAATLLWATLALADSRRTRAWVGYGILWGVTLLTNPAVGSLLPFFLGWLVLRARKNSVATWQLPASALLVAMLCCMPWTFRNYVALHAWVPLRSNFSFELWIGNNNIFDPHAENGRARITRAEETRHYAQVGEISYMREKRAEALSFISAQPRLFSQLTARRIISFWLGTETPLKNFLETDSLLIRFIFVVNFLLLVGALGGLVQLWRTGHFALFPLAAAVLIFPMLYYVTHTLLRYRHPLDPVLVILPVLAASSLFSPDSRRTSAPALAE